VFVCRDVFGAGENSVCLLRFGVNGSFYLNTKKISLCRLVQNFTSLRASSEQAPCKFRASSCMCNAKALNENMQSFCVACAHGGIREFHTESIRVARKRATQKRCTFSCNSDARICKFHSGKLARIWYRLHTWLMTGAFVMPAHTTTHAATHTTKKRQPQHTTITLPLTMADAPPRQALGTKQ